MAYTREGNEPQFVGCVLKEHGADCQIMSDVWEPGTKFLYWNETANQPSQAWAFHPDKVEVDATPEIKQKYFEYVYTQQRKYALSLAEKRASEIKKDVEVRVVGGRLAKKGTVGKVVVTMLRTYGRHYNAGQEYKLGIATSDVMIDVVKNGRTFKNYRDVVWAWARNCERVTPEIVDMFAVEEAALYKTKEIVEDKAGY